jgi:amino acid adenylation domain-containing protein
LEKNSLKQGAAEMPDSSNMDEAPEGIAIIGMAGRFPGANTIQEFWDNLKAGVESISVFTEQELAGSGINVAAIRDNPNYVPARGILADIDLFDAALFGINRREAELIDPQHRLLLECSWEALETAGYDPAKFAGSIGIYAGMSKNTYYLANLYPNRHIIDGIDSFLAEMGNEKDYLTTRISYKLNLTGPSVSVHSACSTSLVAVFHASQSLLSYQCDMALAGGVSVKVPQQQGYWHQEGTITSPDGHCRAFDEQGQGTVFSNGVGMVVLKRLSDAIADGDIISAVIKGISINNDGSAKVSFGAPSVDGQAEVVLMAQALAGIDAETISYIEGHGTATPLGDPIEVAALTQAFRANTDSKGFCALGSVKTNVGHLDAAAGVTGLIKTALSLQHKILPPSLHFTKPNPKFDIQQTPFYVNTKLTPWPAGPTPRRAGVSSFGTGGTNAHAVLEEAPPVEPSSASRSWQLVLISAKTDTALQAATTNLTSHLRANPDYKLADVAYTLNVGRRSFSYRRALVCQDLDDAVHTLESLDPKRIATAVCEDRKRPVAFMFPGQGSQYANMGRELYQSEPTFREHVDLCAEILRPLIGVDLRSILYPDDQQIELASRHLKETAIAQPAIFVIEYALSKVWMEWGIQPESMIGHSVGEFVSACLAGVFSLEDALILLAVRGRLMQELPTGAMLAVPMSAQELYPLLDTDLALAAINGPANCVVSGPKEAIETLEQRLAHKEIAARQLHTSHAFHSAMMEPILDAFTAEVRKVQLHPPQIPFLSSVTGTWITPEQAIDPAYWASHMRQTVRFFEGRQELAKAPDLVLLEVGPGSTLSILAKHPSYKVPGQAVFSSLGHVLDDHQDIAYMLNAMGQLWLAGVSIDWPGFYRHEQRRRVVLPPYPFERKRYWIDPPECQKQVDHRIHSAENNREAHLAPSRVDTEIVSTQDKPVPEIDMNATRVSSRRDRIMAELKSIMYDLGGLEPDTISEQATFLELGFDSLFLTQASLAFKKRFDVKITFRQLLEDTPTLDALAEYVDLQLPPEALPAEIVPALASTAETQAIPHAQAIQQLTPPSSQAVAVDPEQAFTSNSALEQLIHEQLQLMARQLDMLRNGHQHSETVAPLHDLTAAENGRNQPVSDAAKLEQQHRLEQAAPAKSDLASAKRFGPWKPIDKSAVQGLGLQQQKHLDDLIARYTARTSKSKQMAQSHRPHLSDPRSVSGFRTAWKEMIYPIVAMRSSGSKIWDVDGNEYIDVQSGFGSVLFGHSPEFVTQAVKEQIEQGVQIGPQSPLAGAVAKAICDLTGMERVTFCNTGSEAVLAAMRVARTITGRNKIAMFANDYHGIFDEVLVKSIGVGDRVRTAPISPGIPPQTMENILVLEYANPHSIEILQQHAGDVAAVLVEPVQSRHPDLQPGEFLHALREWTSQAGAVLIFDEVVTGFRLHPGGAQAWFGVQADLATYGKIIGGGMPLGVLAGKRAFMDALDGGMWNYGDDSFPEVGVTYFAGTFVRHPLALAAAAAVLKHLKQHGAELQQRLNQRAAAFARDLNAHFTDRRVPIHLEHCASMLFLKFLEESEFSSLLFFYIREKGVHILEGGSFFLTTAHTDEELACVAKAIKDSVAAMQDAGFLPRPPLGGTNLPLQLETTSLAAADLAAALPDQMHSDAGAQGTPSQNAAASQRFPLTEAQMEIWLASQMSEEASCAFNESFMLRLGGLLNVEHMRRAIQVVVARHEALSVRFSPQGEYQERTASIAIDVPLQDLAPLDQAARDAQVAEILGRAASTPFDLSRGPLLNVQILKLAEQEYVILFSAHHIILDGWSSGVLLQEISIVYSAACQGQPYQLPEPTPFSEYVSAEVEQQQSAEVVQAYQYWQNQFAFPPAVLDLPTDRPRPAFKSYKGGTITWTIETSVYQALKRAAAEQHATLFALLLAAYKVLLFRLSGQTDIVVGVSTAGQMLAGKQALVGHCVNLLPLRSQLDDSASFRHFLAATKTAILDAYDHHECTFGGILQRLKLRRDPSRLPLVEVIFNLDRDHAALRFDGLKASIAQAPKRAINFDIFLNIAEADEQLVADWHYNADLFDALTIRRWIGHFETLLEGIVSTPNQRLSELPLLSEAERHQLLVEWNALQVYYPQTQYIHNLFESQVERVADAVAVIGPTITSEQRADYRLTYRELNQRANQLAHYLQYLGVGPEVKVAMYMERSVELVIGILGILKAGGAYVPLDPAYPPERLAFMLADCQAPVLVTQQSLVRMLPDHQAQVICLDTDWTTIARQDDRNPSCIFTADQLAYVIYTSGSTGTPKGVLVTHFNIIRLFEATHSWFHFDADDVWSLFHSYAFDFSVWELWGALIYGGRLVVVPYLVSRSPEAFYALLEREHVTVLNQTPSAFRQLIQVEQSIGCAQPALALRLVIFGGEALDLRSLQPWVERHGDQNPRLVNMYGITETTVHVTYRLLTAVDVATSTGSMIGVPIPDLRLYILDRQLQPVPIGVPGELYIGGAGVARGYLNRPQLTNERFIPNHFSIEPGARLYKSGDLARYLPNRDIEYLGRIDQQVKIRGFRIELGEIETVLGQHPAVREACVLVREDQTDDKRLVAYVVPNQAEAPTISALQHFLKERLPAYMLPAAFILLHTLPLTTNGKVDRRALPMPDHARTASEATFVAARSELEIQFTKIWEQILGSHPIGVQDNFFDLGGHSLLAARMFAQIEQLIGRKLPLAILFQAPTIEELACILGEERLSTSWSSLVPIQPAGSQPPFFCVHAHGGNVVGYYDLAQHIGANQPFYGLQAQGLNGETAGFSQIEAMATHYIKEIQTVQPHGPYFLGGYCMGGAVAYEMAQQLAAQGEQVALLALIESTHPSYPSFLPTTTPLHLLLYRVIARIEAEVNNFYVVKPAAKRAYIVARSQRILKWMRLKAGLLSERLLTTLHPSSAHSDAFALEILAETHSKAYMNYKPRPYHGQVLLVRTSKQPLGIYSDPTLGWGELLAGDVELQEVPGHLIGLLIEPRVQLVAEKLRAGIAKAQHRIRR